MLTPFLLSGVFIIWSSAQLIQHFTDKSGIIDNRNQSHDLTNHLHQDASDYIAFLSILANSPELVNYLNAANNSNMSKRQIEEKKLKQVFTKALSLQPRLYNLELINSTGQPLVTAGSASPISTNLRKTNQHRYSQLLHSEQSSLVQLQVNSNQQAYLQVGISINSSRHKQNRFLLMAQVSTEIIINRLTENSLQFNNQLLLTDQHFNIILAPKTKEKGQEIQLKKLFAQLTNKKRSSKINIKGHVFSAMQLQQFSLDATPYYIFILQSNDSYTNRINQQLILPAIYIILIMLLISILLYYILNKLVISRISGITKIADDIAHNKLEQLPIIDEQDELDQLTNRLANIIDMQGKYNNEIEHAAYFDNLTNLSNRYLFNQMIEKEVERAARYNKSFALIYLDVDGFKKLNDNYGHPFGDKVLIKFAEILQDKVRESDLIGNWSSDNNIARLAGDEFAILLTELNDDSPALHVTKRILSTLEQPITIDEQQILIQTSIGIAHYPTDANSADILIKHADAAMYQAKSVGRNQVKRFSKELNDQIQHQETLYQALIFALAYDELELYFQPYIHAKTGKIAGAEALLRWTSSTLGSVGPAEFIPIAEQYGLVTEIDRWVLRNALKTMYTHKLADKGIKVSINISNLHFHNRFFPEFLVNCMEEFDIGPDQFELEITETAMADLDDQFLEVANSISAIGVSLVLDDFGTGYTSLSHLSHLPISKIKIDRSHVIEITEPNDGIRLVDVLLSISESYKLKITAEGVEEVEQKDYLIENQCDYLQGYLFYKPLPEAMFIEAVNSDNDH